jgi:hypothetical protein
MGFCLFVYLVLLLFLAVLGIKSKALYMIDKCSSPALEVLMDIKFVHTCNINTREAKAGESKVQGQPELHSEILSPKKKS